MNDSVDARLLAGDNRHYIAVFPNRDEVFLQSAVTAMRADKTIERFLYASLLALDIPANTPQGHACIIGQSSIGEKRPLVAPRQLAKIGQAGCPMRQTRIADRGREQNGPILSGQRQGLKQVKNLASVERSAFHLENPNRAFDLRELVEPQANRSSGCRGLGSGDVPGIGHRLTGLG